MRNTCSSTDNARFCQVLATDDDSSSECVSEMAAELAAVKADMQRQVDELHSQLHYWQNTTINILKDHIFSSNTGGLAIGIYSFNFDTQVHIYVPFSKIGATSITGADLIESGIVNNITQSSKHIHNTTWLHFTVTSIQYIHVHTYTKKLSPVSLYALSNYRHRNQRIH